MIRRFDLWDENEFYMNDQPNMEFINNILDCLRGNEGAPLMPPEYNSGPWPEEWISLYERWVEEGCKRLSLVETTGQFRVRRRDENRVELTGYKKNTEKNNAWFQREYQGEDSFIYFIYEEATELATGERIREIIPNVPDTVSSIKVIDKSGVHVLDIPEPNT
ncbi:MAG: hypothetical protein Roseis2KO_43290 [Roseivirga sp.]